MLLVRVRDEYRMILSHYQNLYESSIAFGMRKALQAQRDKDQMVKKIYQLDSECNELDDEIVKLDKSYEDMVRRDEENDVSLRETHSQEVEDEQESIYKLKKRLKEELYNIKN